MRIVFAVQKNVFNSSNQTKDFSESNQIIDKWALPLYHRDEMSLNGGKA
jgi:hypothetical protein